MVMAPNYGLACSLLMICVSVILMEQGMAKVRYGKSVKFKYRRKNTTSDDKNITTTGTTVDTRKKWDAVRVLPRSKVLVDTYLRMHEIVPQILPKAPKNAIEVVYANSIVVDFGNELWPHQIDVMPHRTVWPVEDGAYYTIALFSPDIPTKDFPYEAEYLFWMVANVFDSCTTATGTTYAEYIMPRIAGKVGVNETDKHRLIFFVYKQPNDILEYDLPYMPSDEFLECRKFFNITQLAEKYDLGLPVAANFFQMTRIRPKDKNYEKHFIEL